MPSHHSSKAPSNHPSKAPSQHSLKTPSHHSSKAPSQYASKASPHNSNKPPPKAPRRPSTSSHEDYRLAYTAEIHSKSEPALRDQRYEANQNMEAWRAALNSHCKDDAFVVEAGDEIRRWSLVRECAVGGLIMRGCPVTGYPERHAWERVPKDGEAGGSGEGDIRGKAKSLVMVGLGESAGSVLGKGRGSRR